MRIGLCCLSIAALASVATARLEARSISGTAGIGFATIHLAGTETLTVSSNSQGFYEFYRLMPGTYLVTPYRSGYVFRPSSIQVVLTNNGVGSANFTAVAVTPSNPTASAPPKVPTLPGQTNPVQTSLGASPSNVNLTSAGATVQLTVQAGYSDGSTQNVTSSAAYASNNTAVATVSPSGLVTAKSNGSTTVVASYGGMSASVTVGVNVVTPTFSISGSAGVSSASVKLSGASSAITTASSSGAFSFSGLAAGSYMITPSLSGYGFSPTSQTVTLSNANVSGLNFTASPVQTSLGVSPSNVNLTSAGATAQLTVQAGYSNGSSQTVTSTAAYASNNTAVATVSSSGLVTAKSNGSATILASYGGMSANATVSVNVVTPTFSISGSAGVSSASVKLSGASSATTTASSTGAFSFSGLAAGSYTITPSLAGYGFSPTSQTVTITNANFSGMNFTASSTVSHLVDLSWGTGTITKPAAGQAVVGYNVYRSTVSGGPYTKLNSSPVPGLTYTDSAVSAGQTLYYVCATVDSLGNVSGYSNQALATVPTP